MRQKLLKVFALTMFLLNFTSTVFAIDIYYKNELVPTDASPVVESGRTLVPISSISKSMGASTQWDAKIKTATIKKDDITLQLVLGSKSVKMSKNGEESVITLEVPAKAIDGRTMVPVRAISEIFGSDVKWDGDTNSVLIDSNVPQNMANTDDKRLEKIIAETIKAHSDIFEGIKYDKTKVFMFDETDLYGTKIPMALLNEKVPGSYRQFQLRNVDDEHITYGFIETKTNKIYIESFGVIYSLPDYKVIVPPFNIGIFEDSLEYDIFVRAIAKNQGLAENDTNIYGIIESIDEAKQTALISVYGARSEYLSGYSVDRYARKVTNANTKKVVYDDSAIQNYKETFITQDDADKMALSILRKIKRIPESGKYIVTDLRYTQGDENSDSREGYFFTLRLDGSDRAETVGHFFINSTSTVMRELDVEFDEYYYIYGSATPFG